MNGAAHTSPTDATARLVVYLGMAAGVGKTFRMLSDAHDELADGVDVVIGYLEPHDRAATIAEAIGLEVVPRRITEYRGTRLEELDTTAVLARKPAIVLVDELAHTNAPGSVHQKRYEDVRDLLAAGIEVWSTMNVQHLESLNDQVNELTGTRVRETVPDGLLSEASEVILIDLPPEALIERLQDGKIYPTERVPAALNNFFKIENLGALRTLSLRQVADDVEAKRLTIAPANSRLRAAGQSAPAQAIGERILALITPTPRAHRVVRRAWRSAQRLGCALDILWVKPSNREPTDAELDQLTAIRSLASMLGAEFHTETGDDVAQIVRQLAQQLGTTYVVLGPPGHRNALRRAMQPSLIDRLLVELPGVDVRVIADRSKLPAPEEGT